MLRGRMDEDLYWFYGVKDVLGLYKPSGHGPARLDRDRDLGGTADMVGHERATAAWLSQSILKT